MAATATGTGTGTGTVQVSYSPSLPTKNGDMFVLDRATVWLGGNKIVDHRSQGGHLLHLSANSNYPC